MKPLQDVVVVELANWVAAPTAAAILADLGADVIKVEPLGGDAARDVQRQPKRPEGVPAFDAPFQADNRGKRSAAVAIDRPEGADVVRRLVGAADVFVTNLLPHRQERYGLDAPTLLGIRPRLVHATFTGYGLRGPDVARPGYDATAFFGRGGIIEGMTEPGGVAPHPRPAQGDHTSALALVSGILSSLLLVQRTGEGQVVDASLFATAAWTMMSELAVVLVDGRLPAKRDRFHLITPLTNRFQCGDGRWIILNMPDAHWWPRFCAAIGQPAALEDPRYATVKGRFDHMPEIIGAIDAVMAGRSMPEWGVVFDRAGLIWAPASTVLEVAEDPQAAACDLFPEMDVGGERLRTVAVPFRIAGADIGPHGPAPRVGQHTEALLLAAGYAPDEVERLLTEGVVADASAPPPERQHEEADQVS